MQYCILMRKQMNSLLYGQKAFQAPAKYEMR